MTGAVRIDAIDDFDVTGKTVLVRVDINSPIDPGTGRIANENRLDKSLPTLADLADASARVVVIAHQGDTLDYHNLVSLAEHADKLSAKLGRPVAFLDDVAGPAARAAVRALGNGELLLLENLRFLTEEVSTFENAVKLTAAQMTRTYLLRNLAPLVDLYVNDAFAAAHRNAPSMVAFQELLPSAGGRLLVREVAALEAVAGSPKRPCVYALGGLKISDAFGMMEQVLREGTADTILTSGITGNVMLVADGVDLGAPSMQFLRDRSLDAFVEPAQRLLTSYRDHIRLPLDVAVDIDGRRIEFAVDKLPADRLIVDIGSATINSYLEVIEAAETIFVNGPAGVYENCVSEHGTRTLWEAIAKAKATSVIGGGDTVASAARFISLDDLNFVSTGGGALIRFLSGQRLPLLEAMERAAVRRAQVLSPA